MLNHCPRADDPRNHLILAFLSSVELLKPKYVLLENVRGILTFRLGARQVGLTRVEGGILGGMVMLIKRVLMGLK
jgi:site-specific DNA-cytosine methylase